MTPDDYLDPLSSKKPPLNYMEMNSSVKGEEYADMGGMAEEYTDMGGAGDVAGEEQYAEIPANALPRRHVSQPQIPPPTL